MVSKQLEQRGVIQECLVHTGQHFDENMSEVFFRQLNLRQPDHNLNVNNVSTGKMLAGMIKKLSDVVEDERPAAVLVYGDTTSTLAGSLTATSAGLPLIHVEAGMRNFRLSSPEEVNRIVCDRLSSVMFCSSQQALQQLQKEQDIRYGAKLFFSGDVMLDALLSFKDAAATAAIDLPSQPYVLCTLHRAETVDNKESLSRIFSTLNALASTIHIVMPVHPRTRQRLSDFGIQANFTLIEPLGYLEMMRLTAASELVMTDSGGLQKEAFFLRKKTLILRPVTEWTELIENGYARTVADDFGNITEQYELLKMLSPTFEQPFYGTGHAASFIAETLESII